MPQWKWSALLSLVTSATGINHEVFLAFIQIIVQVAIFVQISIHMKEIQFQIGNQASHGFYFGIPTVWDTERVLESTDERANRYSVSDSKWDDHIS